MHHVDHAAADEMAFLLHETHASRHQLVERARTGIDDQALLVLDRLQFFVQQRIVDQRPLRLDDGLAALGRRHSRQNRMLGYAAEGKTLQRISLPTTHVTYLVLPNPTSTALKIDPIPSSVSVNTWAQHQPTDCAMPGAISRLRDVFQHQVALGRDHGVGAARPEYDRQLAW